MLWVRPAAPPPVPHTQMAPNDTWPCRAHPGGHVEPTALELLEFQRRVSDVLRSRGFDDIRVRAVPT